jgi:hypothetical protein
MQAAQQRRPRRLGQVKAGFDVARRAIPISKIRLSDHWLKHSSAA